MAQRLKGKLAKGPYITNTLGTVQFFYFLTYLVGGWTKTYLKKICASQIGSFPAQKQGWQFPPTYLEFYHLDLVIVGSGCHELPWKWMDFCFSDFPTQKKQRNAACPARCEATFAVWPEGSIHLIWPAFCSIFTPTKTCIVLWKNRAG